jgi:hypothetical protein
MNLQTKFPFLKFMQKDFMIADLTDSCEVIGHQLPICTGINIYMVVLKNNLI